MKSLQFVSIYIKIEIRQKCVISLYKNNKYVKLVPANDWCVLCFQEYNTHYIINQ